MLLYLFTLCAKGDGGEAAHAVVSCSFCHCLFGIGLVFIISTVVSPPWMLLESGNYRIFLLYVFVAVTAYNNCLMRHC